MLEKDFVLCNTCWILRLENGTTHIASQFLYSWHIFIILNYYNLHAVAFPTIIPFKKSPESPSGCLRRLMRITPANTKSRLAKYLAQK